MIQVVILAGGKGARLRPLTERVPKCMVPIHGKPFLEHQILLLRNFGAQKFLVLNGYLGEQVEQYFERGGKWNIHIDYSREQILLGTGGALKKAEPLLESSFLLLNGDTFLPVNYAEIVASFHAKQKLGQIVVYPNRDGLFQNNIAVSAGGDVCGYDKRSSAGMTHIDAGAGVFDRKLLSHILPGRVCSLEEEIFPKLIDANQLACFVTDQRMYDMGSPPELDLIREVLR